MVNKWIVLGRPPFTLLIYNGSLFIELIWRQVEYVLEISKKGVWIWSVE